MDKWMNITDMGYVIASRYNVILLSLPLQQSITFFYGSLLVELLWRLDL